MGLMLRRLFPDTPVVKLARLSALPSAVRAHGEPRLICLDLKLPDTTGVSGVMQVRSMFPELPLAVISASPADDMEGPCLAAGADVYVEKSAPAQQIQSALASLLSIDEDLAESAAAGSQTLSKRQKQLILMLDEGLSNRDIADKLSISEHTVKVHLWRLFRRLQVKNRSQAVHYARRHGYLGD